MPLGLAVGSGCVGPGAARLGERLGDITRSVVAHHTPALAPLAVEPGVKSAEKAVHRRLLLIEPTPRHGPAAWRHQRRHGP